MPANSLISLSFFSSYILDGTFLKAYTNVEDAYTEFLFALEIACNGIGITVSPPFTINPLADIHQQMVSVRTRDLSIPNVFGVELNFQYGVSFSDGAGVLLTDYIFKRNDMEFLDIRCSASKIMKLKKKKTNDGGYFFCLAKYLDIYYPKFRTPQLPRIIGKMNSLIKEREEHKIKIKDFLDKKENMIRTKQTWIEKWQERADEEEDDEERERLNIRIEYFKNQMNDIIQNKPIEKSYQSLHRESDELNREIETYINLLEQSIRNPAKVMMSDLDKQLDPDFYTTTKDIRSESMCKFKFDVYLNVENLNILAFLIKTLHEHQVTNENNFNTIKNYSGDNNNRLLDYYPKAKIGVRIKTATETLNDFYKLSSEDIVSDCNFKRKSSDEILNIETKKKLTAHFYST